MIGIAQQNFFNAKLSRFINLQQDKVSICKKSLCCGANLQKQTSTLGITLLNCIAATLILVLAYSWSEGAPPCFE